MAGTSYSHAVATRQALPPVQRSSATSPTRPRWVGAQGAAAAEVNSSVTTAQRSWAASSPAPGRPRTPTSWLRADTVGVTGVWKDHLPETTVGCRN